ncbi:MAG: hypothetical protein E5Y62_08990 [Mesorhizobium sp.]|nr:MAG: hypothetical protein E5Y62_08990 [Mesorhizobium sp.]
MLFLLSMSALPRCRHLLPYSDGEKGLAATSTPSSATLDIGEILSHGGFLPVTIRGEVPGRAMRGSANLRRFALGAPPPTRRRRRRQNTCR